MKLEYSLILYTKLNVKWLKNLKTRHNTVKFQGENVGKIFSDINHSSVFWGHFQCNRNKSKNFNGT